jgi:hypothetical protein
MKSAGEGRLSSADLFWPEGSITGFDLCKTYCVAVEIVAAQLDQIILPS